MPPPAPKPAPAPRGGGGFASRLTNKVGPLPVWAWAALILGLILLYMRLRPAGPPAASEAPAPGPETGQAGGVPSAGGTSSGFGDGGADSDLLAQLYGINAASIDSLTNALLTQQSLAATAGSPSEGTVPTAGNGIAPGAVAPNGPATAPAPASKASAPGTTQTQAGVLYWDGKAFTTKAAFNAWLKARGFSANQYLANKPQAKAIYSTLP